MKLLCLNAGFVALFVACAISASLGSDALLGVVFGFGAVLMVLSMVGFWLRQVRVRTRGADGIVWNAERGCLTVEYQPGVTWRLRTPRLTVSPTTVRHEFGRKTMELEWTDIITIRCGGETNGFYIGILTPTSSAIRIYGESLKADPALVYATLDFYAAHAESRVELGTMDALNRIREARFS